MVVLGWLLFTVVILVFQTNSLTADAYYSYSYSQTGLK